MEKYINRKIDLVSLKDILYPTFKKKKKNLHRHRARELSRLVKNKAKHCHLWL